MKLVTSNTVMAPISVHKSKTKSTFRPLFSFRPKHSALVLACGLAFASFTHADLIFSEYIEGSGYNKAIELMNTGTTAVDLSQYSVELYSNANYDAAQSTQLLSGTLDAGMAYVIGNSDSRTTAEIVDVSDIRSSVVNFNGDDRLFLLQNGAVVDRIGQKGVRVTFAANVTLVRNSDITVGDTAVESPFDPSIEWTEYPQDTFTYLGNGTSGGGGGEDPEEPEDLVCADPATLISEVQGSGSTSPLVGNQVIIEAIVTMNPASNGYFVQEEDADADADPLTSEGLFVYDPTNVVSVGDLVRISGTADEFYDSTQLSDVTQLLVCSSGNSLPTAGAAQLPLAASGDFEALENMLVSFSDTLTVNEVYNLGRYGEFLVANGRRFIPTDIAAPGPEADAVREYNQRNMLFVEDGISSQNPDPIIFPAPGLDAFNTLRVGDTVNNLTGILNFSYGAFKLIPNNAPVFNGDNPRTDSPVFVEESDMRIASFNVLNFFNGDGLGDGFPTPRGADTQEELDRQTAKLVAAINAINADLLGLMELENDGFDENSAIAELVNALNTELAVDDQYEYVQPTESQIGTDAIAVGIIYRPSKINLVNAARILDSASSPLDDEGNPLFVDTLNRPALAQSFEDIASGERFTVVVNHLKSKGGSNCDTSDDCDVGQGAYNIARTNAAEALGIWLASDPTGVDDSDVLVMGDLNAYSKEDPIASLEGAGYTLLKEDGGYSYVYSGETGSLDHALASSSLAEKMINVQDWHINTDEPRILDYNTEFKSVAQQLSLYAPNAFRSSDHDPVIIDFNLNTPPTPMFRVFRFFRWYIFLSDSTDSDGTIASQTWQVGDYTGSYRWLFVPKRYIHRNKIDTVTLSVTDNSGREASLTTNFR